MLQDEIELGDLIFVGSWVGEVKYQPLFMIVDMHVFDSPSWGMGDNVRATVIYFKTGQPEVTSLSFGWLWDDVCAMVADDGVQPFPGRITVLSRLRDALG